MCVLFARIFSSCTQFVFESWVLRSFVERYEPPRVRVDPNYVLVRMGEMVELHCIATGYPEPTIEWSDSRGTLPADADVRDGRLRFELRYRDQEGEYTCRASNSAGQDSATVTVAIEGTRTVLFTDARLTFIQWRQSSHRW